MYVYLAYRQLSFVEIAQPSGCHFNAYMCKNFPKLVKLNAVNVILRYWHL